MLLRRLVVPSVGLVLLGSGIAVAAIPDSEGVISACYSDRTGEIRVIDAGAGETCDRRESALSWNQEGPQGEPGLQGIPGQDGEDGAPGPGLASIEDLAGTPCRVGSPDEGVVEVDYGPAANVRAIELGCRTSTLHNLSVTKTGQGTVSGGGISCGTVCSAEYAPGTEVELTATAASGYRFTGWSGACTGVDTCRVTISGDATVAATFAEVASIRFSLTSQQLTPFFTSRATVDISGGWSGGAACRVQGNESVLCEAVRLRGETVTLSVTGVQGTFMWSGACAGSGATCTLPLNNAFTFASGHVSG